MLLLTRCDDLSILWGAGTHGSLGSYSYDVSKDSLEKSIELLIKSENRITKLKTDSGNDTYVKISIRTTDIEHFFVFRYAGDKEYWELHPTESHISITAVRKGEGEYKSEGEITKKERKEAIEIFENYFIKELEKSTGLKPKND